MKVLSGIQMKLSWLSPKTAPFFSATPITLRGWPSTSISLPIGSIIPKKASRRSVPMTATIAAWVTSCCTMWRPDSSSRIVPMRAMFSVMPAMPTFFWIVRPRLTLLPVQTWAPTSEHSVHAFLTASKSSMLRRLRFIISIHCSWLVMRSGMRCRRKALVPSSRTLSDM